MGTRSGASDLRFNSYALELVPMFYYRYNTQVQMFYFLNMIRFFVFIHI